MIIVAQVNSHSSFLLPAWNVFFQCFYRTVLKGKLDNGSISNITFFVYQHCGFLVSVQFLQEVDVVMFDTARFAGVPN